MNCNCSNFLDMRNLQEQVKKAFCYQKLFWFFTVWINCSSDLKTFANSWPSASNFKTNSRSLEQFFLTVGQTILVTKYHFFNRNSNTPFRTVGGLRSISTTSTEPSLGAKDEATMIGAQNKPNLHHFLLWHGRWHQHLLGQGLHK